MLSKTRFVTSMYIHILCIIMCNIYHYIAILRHDFWPRDQTAACILMIKLVGQKAGPDNYIYLTKLRLWKLLETVQTKLWITDINFQLAWYFLWGELSLKKVPDISVMLRQYYALWPKNNYKSIKEVSWCNKKFQFQNHLDQLLNYFCRIFNFKGDFNSPFSTL